MTPEEMPGPPYPEQVQRTCRYKHGPLQAHPATFSMESIAALSPEPNKGERLIRSGELFVVGIAVCPRCGYIELFDTEPAVQQ